MAIGVAESRYAQDSSWIVAGFTSIEVPRPITRELGWYNLGKIANRSLEGDVSVGLKIRLGKQSLSETNQPFSARLAEEMLVIAALQQSGEFDELLLPLFMGLAIDQKGYEVGILTEDLDTDGGGGWQITDAHSGMVGNHNVNSVLEVMEASLRGAGYKIDDYPLGNNVLLEFNGRLAACDLEQIVILRDEPAKTEYETALSWIREGHLNVPILVKEDI